MPHIELDANDIDFTALSLRTHYRSVLRVPACEREIASTVPVHILVGRKRQPRLAVIAGVHGDEYDGIRAAQRLAAEEEPAALEGTLVVIPIANPSAFAAGQRETAIDNIDLNRVFPGDPCGGAASRLAHVLCDKLLRHMDLVFSLHGASSVTRLARYLEFFARDDRVGRASYAAAAAAGFTDLVAFPDTPGYLLPALGRLGVPVIEGEVGGRGELHEENAAYYLARIHAVMQHLGIGGGPAQMQQANIWQTVDIDAPQSGLLSRDVALNAKVVPGQRLGCILGPDGETLAEMTVPIAGMIGGFRAHARIETGQLAFRIFTPADVSGYGRVAGIT